MATFMLSLIYDPSVPSDGSPSKQTEHAALTEEMRLNGHHVSGGGLLPVEQYARRYYRRNNKPVLVDGPFTETKEALGGYFIVDCDEAQALEYASRVPVNNRSWVEVRKIFVIQK